MAALPPQQAERAALCDLFLKVGPEAPTLCEGWATYDLAAHLVIRERKPLSGPGLVMGGAAARLTARILARAKERHSYAELVALVRRGPPAVLAPFDKAMNLTEFFVHHEDVRRGAGDNTPRIGAEGAQIEDALWHMLRRGGKFMTRSVKDIGIDLVRPERGRHPRPSGSPRCHRHRRRPARSCCCSRAGAPPRRWSSEEHRRPSKRCAPPASGCKAVRARRARRRTRGPK